MVGAGPLPALGRFFINRVSQNEMGAPREKREANKPNEKKFFEVLARLTNNSFFIDSTCVAAHIVQLSLHNFETTQFYAALYACA